MKLKNTPTESLSGYDLAGKVHTDELFHIACRGGFTLLQLCKPGDNRTSCEQRTRELNTISSIEVGRRKINVLIFARTH